MLIEYSNTVLSAYTDKRLIEKQAYLILTILMPQKKAGSHYARD